jgi:hypothetical protein
MKILKLLLVGLAFTAAAAGTAQARDSFSVGINVGGYGYAPPPVYYYPAPARSYYAAPTVYYSEPVRYAPIVSYSYYNDGYRDNRWGNHHGYRNHGYNNHEERHEHRHGRD